MTCIFNTIRKIIPQLLELLNLALLKVTLLCQPCSLPGQIFQACFPVFSTRCPVQLLSATDCFYIQTYKFSYSPRLSLDTDPTASASEVVPHSTVQIRLLLLFFWPLV